MTTVSELIKKLQKVANKKARVSCYNLDDGSYLKIESVETTEDGIVDLNLSQEVKTKAHKEFNKTYHSKFETRKEKYLKLISKRGVQKVYTKDNEVGVVLGETTAHRSEAGLSRRLKVLWKDGKTTNCCIKGMTSYKRIHFKIR